MYNKQQTPETETKTTNIPYKNCLNCGTELNGMYCHICGQQATSKTPTVAGFILEYLNNAFLWDPQFFQTIGTLIKRPGHLTNEYMSGKFTSQEHPLKLNMFLLFVTITLFVFFSGTEKMNDSVDNIMNDERVFSSLQLEDFMKSQDNAEKIKDSQRDTIQLFAPLLLAENYPSVITQLETIEDTQGKGLDKWTAVIPHTLIEEKILVPDTDGYYHFNTETNFGNDAIKIINTVWTKMVDITTQYFPMIVLFTAPFLSMSLSLVQRKSRLPHIHHFIFALHYTALLEFLMICIYVLHLTCAPSMELLQYTMIIASCTYLTIAFRQVYKTSTWMKAIVKALFTSLFYVIINLLIFIIIFFIAIFNVIDKI